MLCATTSINPLLYLFVKVQGEILTVYKDACSSLSLEDNQIMAERSCDDLTQLTIEPIFYAGDSHKANVINGDANYPHLENIPRLCCRKHLILNIIRRAIRAPIEFAHLNAPTFYATTLKPLQGHHVALVANVFNQFKIIETVAASESCFGLVFPHFSPIFLIFPKSLYFFKRFSSYG